MSTLRALVITPDANVRWEPIESERAAERVHELVGGYIELVAIQPGIMHGYVNEDSKMFRHPINHLGTLTVAVLGKRPGAVYDPLRGTLVILGDGRDGEEASAPQTATQGVLDAYLQSGPGIEVPS